MKVASSYRLRWGYEGHKLTLLHRKACTLKNSDDIVAFTKMFVEIVHLYRLHLSSDGFRGVGLEHFVDACYGG